jgi:hypothetical protein
MYIGMSPLMYLSMYLFKYLFIYLLMYLLMYLFMYHVMLVCMYLLMYLSMYLFNVSFHICLNFLINVSFKLCFDVLYYVSFEDLITEMEPSLSVYYPMCVPVSSCMFVSCCLMCDWVRKPAFTGVLSYKTAACFHQDQCATLNLTFSTGVLR